MREHRRSHKLPRLPPSYFPPSRPIHCSARAQDDPKTPILLPAPVRQLPPATIETQRLHTLDPHVPLPARDKRPLFAHDPLQSLKKQAVLWINKCTCELARPALVLLNRRCTVVFGTTGFLPASRLFGRPSPFEHSGTLVGTVPSTAFDLESFFPC